MIRTILLSELGASPGNVRRSGDPQADLELKADIEACDLRNRRRRLQAMRFVKRAVIWRRAIVPASSARPARTSWTRASSSSSRKSRKEADVSLAAPRGGSCGRARTAFPRYRPGTANRN
jgi:hypothetical protein